METPPPEPEGSRGPASRVAGYRRAVERRRAQVDELAPRVPPLRHALELAGIDQRRAGALLAGGLAFRLFLFFIPSVLVINAILGVFADYTDEPPETLARQVGLSAFALESVTRAGESASGGRVAAAVVVGLGVAVTGSGFVRVVQVCHLLAWDAPLRRVRTSPLAVLAAFGFIVVMLVASWLSARLRGESAVLGLFVGLPAAFLLEAGLWLLISIRLPHGDAPWRALLPGAVLVGAGGIALHGITSFYLVRRADRAAELYGPLGVATVLLLWLFIACRVIIASAFLNSMLWKSRQPEAGEA